MFKKWPNIQTALDHRYYYHIWCCTFHNNHNNHFEAVSSSKMTISGQIEVKNYFDKPILRLILSIVFFRRYLSRFLWKACKISRIFNPYWNFWTFLRHFRSISDPKSALFVENLTWTYIGWHQKLFYGLQSLRNHVISHCYSRRTLISINLLKNQNSIQMGTLSLIY